jgi:hypothetical protein
MLLMGKLTISTGPFSSSQTVRVYQAGYSWNFTINHRGLPQEEISRVFCTSGSLREKNVAGFRLPEIEVLVGTSSLAKWINYILYYMMIYHLLYIIKL